MYHFLTDKPYHPDNLRAQPYSIWRVILLSYVGKVLGIQFKIAGIPYGADYNESRWENFYSQADLVRGLK